MAMKRRMGDIIIQHLVAYNVKLSMEKGVSKTRHSFFMNSCANTPFLFKNYNKKQYGGTGGGTHC